MQWVDIIIFSLAWAGFIDQEKDAAPVWWLEGCSYPIQVLDKEKVKVLVRSDELKRRYKDDPVIISFEWGKGIVYHMISHFYLQRSETRTKKQGDLKEFISDTSVCCRATKHQIPFLGGESLHLQAPKRERSF